MCAQKLVAFVVFCSLVFALLVGFGLIYVFVRSGFFSKKKKRKNGLKIVLINSNTILLRSKFRFYLRLFFDLFDVALVNSVIVYKKLENKNLKDFKICIALKLIFSFVSQRLSCLNHRPSKHTKAQRPSPIPPSHLPIFLETRWRCIVCSQAGKGNRTFVTSSLCDVALCLQKERNCFLQYHS